MKRFNNFSASALIIASMTTLTIGNTYANEATNEPKKWGISLAAMTIDPAYIDYHNDVMALPLITYEDDDLFLRGLAAGYILLKDDNHKLSINTYFMGLRFNPDDSDNQSLKHLNKRQSTLMAGVGYSYSDKWGTIRAEISADTLNKSQGVLAELAYLHHFKQGNALITPAVGVIWADSNHNNYYYGVSVDEARRSNLSEYAVSNAASPYIELSAAYQFNQNWRAFFNGRVTYLSNAVQDSPMIDSSYIPMVITGIHYSF